MEDRSNRYEPLRLVDAVKYDKGMDVPRSDPQAVFGTFAPCQRECREQAKEILEIVHESR